MNEVQVSSMTHPVKLKTLSKQSSYQKINKVPYAIEK